MTNVLLMSADKELLRLVKGALEGLPVKVIGECQRFRKAVDIMHENAARIVIIDMFLPESSGLEAIKSLKQMDDKMIMILLSRMRGRSLLDRAFRHGATDVLHYPLSAETIRQTVLHRLSRLPDDSMVVFQHE